MGSQDPDSGGERGTTADGARSPSDALRSAWARIRAAWPPMRPIPRGVRLVAAALLAVHALLIVADGRATDAAIDEDGYINSGSIILRHGWKHNATVLQGPIPLYANQLFMRDFPRGGFIIGETPHVVLERGRLGTLPFALLSAALVFLWARALFG